MTHQVLISSTLILLVLHSTTISAESPVQSPSHQPPIPVKSPPSIQPPSQAPESPIPKKSAPPNVTDILEKAGGFSIFTRLLRDTNVVNQIENQLNSTNALTILAPPDSGFSGLKSGTLNSLTAEQKVQLLQFHILPNFVSLQNFETLTNPVRTQASNTEDYPLNISTGAGNSVNVSTGVVNATLSGTVYSDSKLAVYRVDSVLLPLAIFGPSADSPSPSPSPALAPAPEAVPALKKKPKKEASAVAAAKAGTADDSAATPTGSAKAPAAKANSSTEAAVSPAVAADESGVSRLAEVGFVVMAVVFGQLVV